MGEPLPILPPLRTIREHCVECCAGCRTGPGSPAGCNSPACALFPLRLGRRVDGVSPLRSIRVKCLECAGSAAAVRNCTDTDCGLFPYRFGRNPKRAGIGGRNLPQNGQETRTQRRLQPAESQTSTPVGPPVV